MWLAQQGGEGSGFVDARGSSVVTIESSVRARLPRLAAGFAVCLVGMLLQLALLVVVVLHMFAFNGSSRWPGVLLVRAFEGPWPTQFVESFIRLGLFCLLAAWMRALLRRRRWRRIHGREVSVRLSRVPHAPVAVDDVSLGQQLADDYVHRLGRLFTSPLSREGTRTGAESAGGRALPVVQTLVAFPGDEPVLPAISAENQPSEMACSLEEEDLTSWRSGRPLGMFYFVTSVVLIVAGAGAAAFLGIRTPASQSSSFAVVSVLVMYAVLIFSATIPPPASPPSTSPPASPGPAASAIRAGSGAWSSCLPTRSCSSRAGGTA